jgi:hypothetical protein
MRWLGRKGITGTYTPERDQLLEIKPHEGFDRAWQNALEKAAKEWAGKSHTSVRVRYRARIDVWNPGGIGEYQVIITPGGGS